MSAVSEVLMTTEELLALPEDGIDRELIRGQLREKPMTTRNPRHCRIEANVATLFRNWLTAQPTPRGAVLSGEARFRLRRNPDTMVGIDVAYVSREMMADTPENAARVEGPPVLAVEILSPSDKQEDIYEKVKEYLNCGVALVWVVDPYFNTVRVHKPGQEPEHFNMLQQLPADPALPGFSAKVTDIFAD